MDRFPDRISERPQAEPWARLHADSRARPRPGPRPDLRAGPRPAPPLRRPCKAFRPAPEQGPGPVPGPAPRAGARRTSSIRIRTYVHLVLSSAFGPVRIRKWCGGGWSGGEHHSSYNVLCKYLTRVDLKGAEMHWQQMYVRTYVHTYIILPHPSACAPPSTSAPRQPRGR